MVKKAELSLKAQYLSRRLRTSTLSSHSLTLAPRLCVPSTIDIRVAESMRDDTRLPKLYRKQNKNLNLPH